MHRAESAPACRPRPLCPGTPFPGRQATTFTSPRTSTSRRRRCRTSRSRPTRCSPCDWATASQPCRRARPAPPTSGTSGRALTPTTAALARVAAPTAPGLRGLPQGVPGGHRAVHVEPQRQRDHLLLARLLRHQPGHRRGAARPATRRPRRTASRSTTIRRSRQLIDTAMVDQTTYTASDRLYADGTLLLAGAGPRPENNGLTWSAGASFTKASPPVMPSSPVGGALVPGTTPFRWNAAAVRRVLHGRGLQEQRPDLQRRQPDLHRHGARRPRTPRPTRSPRPAPRTCGGSAGRRLRQPRPVVEHRRRSSLRRWRRACSRPRPGSG